MHAPRKQRDIIDRRAVIEQLDAAVADGSLKAPQRRAKVLEIFKAAHRKGWDEVRRRFETGEAGGEDSVRAHSFLVDQIVRLLYDYVTKHLYPVSNPTTGEQLSVVAVGGYGRGELAPFSDVDLLFLLPYKKTAHAEQVVESMLYTLWDMGLKVGHATRSIDDCLVKARGDVTIRTALLEARWVWGDQRLFTEFRRRFQAELVASTGTEFVEAKLAERDERHQRMGDSRYVLEPNVKEGKGGLRDLHSLIWIARYLYDVTDVHQLVDRGVLTAEQARTFAKALEFLWTVRCHLHYLADRPEDRLTFDVQPRISERMNYTQHAGTRGVERFMKHYFLVAKDVGDLTRIFCAVLEEQQRKPRLSLMKLLRRRTKVEGFRVDGGRLNVAREDDFAKDPVKILRLFHVAQQHELDIHPNALRLVTQNLKRINDQVRNDPEANRLFLEMLTSPQEPEITLRRLNEAGVFGRFVPDFGRVVAQMQYDMYHVYTVDEHSILAIGTLHRIERGLLAAEVPLSTEIVHKVLSRRALYLAVLLHDIAKGRGGDHSVLGARVARKLGPRLGLTEEETETVAWLVRHHLLMSHTAFKRDIDDPKTISDFVALVQSPERLKLLLLLTVVDIRAVGPSVWNGWKATLLRELYHRALDLMSGGLMADAKERRVEAAKDALRTRLADWPAERIETHLALGYPSYWLSADPDTHERNARMIADAEARGTKLHVESRVDRYRAITEVTIHAPDHPGLFSRIAGAMAVAGASIVEARIHTLTNGMALDTFTIQDSRGGAFDSPAKLAKLSATIEQVLAGRLRPTQEIAKRQTLPSRTWVFKVPPRVLIDNTASATHTLIEVNGRDRPGFLYDVTSALTDLGLQIGSARIATYGERVVDVFYVKDVFGLKITHEGKLDQIRQRLLSRIIEPGSEPPAQEPPSKPAPKPSRRAEAKDLPAAE